MNEDLKLLKEQETEKKEKIDLKLAEKRAREPLTTMKKFVYVCLLNGILWVWCSYILAFLGKMDIAESLSKVAITEIVGVVLVYAIKSLFENLSKNNHWPDKGFTDESHIDKYDDEFSWGAWSDSLDDEESSSDENIRI